MTQSKRRIPAQATQIDPANGQKAAAKQFAALVGAARRESGAPVRHVLSRKATPDDPSVLARLLSGGSKGGGGRGGEVRLKLYVSLLWICAREPFATTKPARAWAELLGLEDPSGAGTRRIQKALSDLESIGLVTVAERPGHSAVITILSEAGDRSVYTSPADAHSALKAAGAPREVLALHEYVKLPSTFWTEGQIARLSAAGLAMLLILKSEAGSGKKVWVAPSRFSERYGLAGATQTKGIAALRGERLITSKSLPVGESGMSINEMRIRKVHTLRI